MSVRESLKEALKSRCVVRLFREDIEEGWFNGRVSGLSQSLFALDVIDDANRLDGVSVLRVSDLSRLDVPAPHAKTTEKILEMRPGHAWRAFDLQESLSDFYALLKECQRHHEPITLYCEKVESDLYYIGVIEALDKKEVTLKLLNAHAQWELDTERFVIDKITRIDIGAAYETGLLLVAKAEASS